MKEIESIIIGALEEKPLTQRELRDLLGISKSYLSEKLKEMEINGLIKRKEISKRTVLVSLNHDKILKIGVLKASEYAAVFLTAQELRDYYVMIKIYDNGLQELRDLLLKKIDVAFAPVVTGFIMHFIDKRIKLVSFCAKGGSGIVHRGKINKIGSTLFSTMDLNTRVYLNYDVKNIKYFDSPEKLIEAYRGKTVDAITIWEPYLSSIEGEKEIVGKDSVCCGSLIMDFNKKVEDFLDTYIKNTEALMKGEKIKDAVRATSLYLKFDEKIIEKSLKSYEFLWRIDKNEIKKNLENMKIIVPDEVIDSYTFIIKKQIDF